VGEAEKQGDMKDQNRDPEESRSIAYQVLPYMEHLSDSDFAQRVSDIYLHVILGAPPGVLVKSPRMGWESLWRDAVDEAYRRFGVSVAEQFLEYIRISCRAAWRSRPRLIPELSKEATTAFIRRADINGTSFLVRYSRRRYLEPLVAHGELTIFPATRYDDPSLNPAVRDKELEVTIQPHGMTAEVFDRSGKAKGRIRVIDSRLSAMSQTDFYVHSLSRTLAPELFPDFDADACVVIRDPRLYVRRILDAMHAQLPHPAWGGDIEEVKYVDPLNIAMRQILIPLHKHFFYARQQEVRVIWMPTHGARELSYIVLNMGSMEDCCTLLVP
jgi:hypothetical protein